MPRGYLPRIMLNRLPIPPCSRHRVIIDTLAAFFFLIKNVREERKGNGRRKGSEKRIIHGFNDVSRAIHVATVDIEGYDPLFPSFIDSSARAASLKSI